jgi:predicted cation transporter
MLEGLWLFMALGGLMAVVLLLPFFSKRVEEELEAFIMVIGLAAVTTSGLWSWSLLAKAAHEPLAITIAVLVAGFIFYFMRSHLNAITDFSIRKFGLRIFVFLLVAILGLCSSIITAIVAAAVLAAVIMEVGLERKSLVKVIVFGCFAIGLGAALSRIGEPLSTIVVSKLQGEPYQANGLFLLQNLGPWIIPSVLIMALLAAFSARHGHTAGTDEVSRESVKTVIGKGVRTYIFVAGLVLLAEGLKPLMDRFVIGLPHAAIYWINISSAALDNATLAAAEISPKMDMYTIKSAILGLLAAGGILIPGNIPNIICASKLGIKSKEWAKVGAPVGIILMIIIFVGMMLTN